MYTISHELKLYFQNMISKRNAYKICNNECVITSIDFARVKTTKDYSYHIDLICVLKGWLASIWLCSLVQPVRMSFDRGLKALSI